MSTATGSTVRHTSPDRIKKFEFYLPTIEEQRAIGQILGILDQAIRINSLMSQTLEDISQMLFKRWFIDFEFPDEKNSPYKSSGGDMVDSELGEIPKDWRVSSLSEAFEINPIRNLPKNSLASYVEIANMPTTTGRIRRYIDRQYTSGSKFTNGDTLIARITPCLENGKTAIVDFLKDGFVGWGSTEYIVLRPKSPLPPEYGYFLARSERFRSYAISNMTGSSGRQRVPTNCFKNFNIIIPETNIVNRFGNFAKISFTLMRLMDNQSSTLTKMHDLLLPRLIFGKMRIGKP